MNDIDRQDLLAGFALLGLLIGEAVEHAAGGAAPRTDDGDLARRAHDLAEAVMAERREVRP